MKALKYFFCVLALTAASFSVSSCEKENHEPETGWIDRGDTAMYITDIPEAAKPTLTMVSFVFEFDGNNICTGAINITEFTSNALAAHNYNLLSDETRRDATLLKNTISIDMSEFYISKTKDEIKAEMVERYFSQI